MVLVFEEGPDPDGTPADPRRRHAVRLSQAPVVMTDHVAGHAVLAVTWHDGDALPFALRLDNAVARGNVVLADHGRSEAAAGDALDPPTPLGTRPWRPALAEDRGIIQAVPYDRARLADRQVAEALRQDPAAALPALRLTHAARGFAPATWWVQGRALAFACLHRSIIPMFDIPDEE